MTYQERQPADSIRESELFVNEDQKAEAKTHRFFRKATAPQQDRSAGALFPPIT
ncbi:MAG: hypothetical protein R3F11_27585 [Verrucomicrobiales bacterium]